MPQLFTLPQVVPLSSLGAILPGSRLYFYQTATSTAQPVYQDIELATPHPQPVEADAAGVFAAIYLNGALPDYRVKLTDASNVVLWELDDIPSSQDMMQSLRIKSTTPEIIFEETDADAGERKSRIRVSSEVITWDLLNDAENTATEIVRIARAGGALGTVTIAGTAPLTGANAYKPGSVTRALTVTLADDNHLLLSLIGGASYVIEGHLIFDAATTSGMGAKFALNYSGASPSQKDALITYHVNGSGAITYSPMTNSVPIAFATIATTTEGNHLHFRKYFQTTTLGTLALQWAQNSSSANALRLYDGSWMRAMRVG